MKKYLIFVLLFLGTVSITIAQPSIGVFTGYGISSFNKDLLGEDLALDETTSYLPLGVQLGYNLSGLSFGSLSFLAELNYSVIPFSYETFGNLTGEEIKTSDIEISQTVIGAVFKMKFGNSFFRPFIRLGAGAYLGAVSIQFTDEVKNLFQENNIAIEDTDYDFKTAFGFNIGAGTDLSLGTSTALFSEFVYHIVSRELDVEGAQSQTANNWGILLGFQFSL